MTSCRRRGRRWPRRRRRSGAASPRLVEIGGRRARDLIGPSPKTIRAGSASVFCDGFAQPRRMNQRSGEACRRLPRMPARRWAEAKRIFVGRKLDRLGDASVLIFSHVGAYRGDGGLGAGHHAFFALRQHRQHIVACPRAQQNAEVKANPQLRCRVRLHARSARKRCFNAFFAFCAAFGPSA